MPDTHDDIAFVEDLSHIGVELALKNEGGLPISVPDVIGFRIILC